MNKKMFYTSVAALSLAGFVGADAVAAEEVNTLAVANSEAVNGETLLPASMEGYAIAEVREVSVSAGGNFDNSQVVFEIGLTDEAQALDQEQLRFDTYILDATGATVGKSLAHMSTGESLVTDYYYTTGLPDGTYTLETRGADAYFFSHSTIPDSYILYKGSTEFSVVAERVVSKQVVEVPEAEIPVTETEEVSQVEPVTETEETPEKVEEEVVVTEEITPEPTPEVEEASTEEPVAEVKDIPVEETEINDSREEVLTDPTSEPESAEDTEQAGKEEAKSEETPAKKDKNLAPVQNKTVSSTEVQSSESIQPAVTSQIEAAPKTTYSRVAKAQANQSTEKSILPNTGEAGSILALVGGLLSSIGFVGIKRRKSVIPFQF